MLVDTGGRNLSSIDTVFLYSIVPVFSLSLSIVVIVRDNEGLQQSLYFFNSCCSCPVTSNIVSMSPDYFPTQGNWQWPNFS